MDEGARLELRGVRFSYGAAQPPAIDAVSLSLSAGRCLGVIGPNGAGKSTLLRLSAGLLRPSSGEVLIGRRSTRRLSPGELGRLVAYVPQSLTMPFSISALELVLQGRHPHLGRAAFESRGDLEIARSVMEQTGTWALRGRPFDALSGGERQRVVIATALAQEPRLLILDEPTSALDLRFQNTTVRLIRELVREQELAVLVAIHDLNLAGGLCDELALIVGGRLRESGAPEEVLTRETLEGAYETQLLVGQSPEGVRYVLPRP